MKHLVNLVNPKQNEKGLDVRSPKGTPLLFLKLIITEETEFRIQRGQILQPSLWRGTHRASLPLTTLLNLYMDLKVSSSKDQI